MSTTARRIDRDSPEYKRELLIVALLVTFFTLTGGALLGYKITSAEAARESGEMDRAMQETRGKVPGREHGIMN